jgi:hypothetical protein
LIAPGLIAPGLIAPGLIAPGLSAPGLIDVDFIALSFFNELAPSALMIICPGAASFDKSQIMLN